MSIEKCEFDTTYFNNRIVTMPVPGNKDEIVLYEMVLKSRIKRAVDGGWCALPIDSEAAKAIDRERYQKPSFKVHYGYPYSKAWKELVGANVVVKGVADRDLMKGVKNAMFISLSSGYDYLGLHIPKGTVVIISPDAGTTAKIAFNGQFSKCFSAESLITEQVKFTSSCMGGEPLSSIFGDKRPYRNTSGAVIKSSCPYPSFSTFAISINKEEYVLCIEEHGHYR